MFENVIYRKSTEIKILIIILLVITFITMFIFIDYIFSICIQNFLSNRSDLHFNIGKFKPSHLHHGPP